MDKWYCWSILHKLILSVNEGHNLEGTELNYVLMDKRIIQVSSYDLIPDTWTFTVRSLSNLFENWDKMIQSYIDDGGDEEYGSIECWGGMISWIESNCPIIGQSTVTE